ncbi:hypothetical protein DGMP_30050 [Desulfomarina profundi]|uniref:GmrSD restriction endonucleases N-terminal domain-containing protein n=1 Tax=Desulfomarina profundi TaxID=2772557 RepID=A0A8D5FYI9_9BACT|nr:DUF262 domain-containing protein [Desulfomarina profundi]BCL62312.1 hypothetical protein DGMP_30050 [Desulfomarina profundi]
MKDAQKPDHVSLNTLIMRLREGQFVIPDFQREFEWKPWDIKELMRSIFLDYYIGSLLLWKGKQENFNALSCERIYGYPKGNGNPVHIVLDGQQRLTAMYYAFLAPDVNLPNRANRALYFVHVDKFMAEEYDDAFNYDWLTRRWSKIIDNPEVQYEQHIFPLAIMGAGGWELPNWVQGYEQFWKNRTQEAEEAGDADAIEMAAKSTENAHLFGEHLKGITEQYQVAYIELDQDLAVDKVCDIFTQINSKGIRLDAFDLINALLKPKGLQLKHMWRAAASRLEFVETEKMNVYILQVMSILRQSYCSPKYLYFLLPGQEKPVRDPDGTRRKEVLITDAQDFEGRWHNAVDALQAAIKLLQHPHEFAAISSKYLPYVSILPVFASIQAHIKTIQASQRLDAQRKARHWYWASVFTNRYSGSVESTSARDFMDMKAWLQDDNAEPPLITEFKTRFKTLEFRKETKRGTSVYNGLFNLLVLMGARDWMSGNVTLADDLDDHHIVPKKWGAEHLQGKVIDTILNRTPLSAETNRHVISDRLPNQYLPDLIAENGEAAVRSILESHCISPAALAILLRDPFTAEDFEEFIAERQRTFQEAIETLLVKERLDLPVQLRELDEQIEQIELGLRKVIVAVLQADSQYELPSHILRNVKERIQRAAKKNAALDGDYYDTLEGKMEFCDLRELHDAIKTKALWPQFQPRFVNKETLNIKFGQLAELRNAIRHSRSADEITRKEGEAAILWFAKVLK